MNFRLSINYYFEFYCQWFFCLFDSYFSLPFIYIRFSSSLKWFNLQTTKYIYLCTMYINRGIDFYKMKEMEQKKAP